MSLVYQKNKENIYRWRDNNREKYYESEIYVKYFFFNLVI